MQVELQNAMQHLVATQSLNLKEISRFTPSDFRSVSYTHLTLPTILRV